MCTHVYTSMYVCMRMHIPMQYYIAFGGVCVLKAKN